MAAPVYPSLVTLAEPGPSGAPYSASNPVPVTLVSPAGVDSYADGSGAIGAPATAQQVFAQNAARKYLFILNISDTDMWINFGVNAVADQPSIKLVANGGYFEPLVPSDQAVSIICASAGKKFVAKQA